MCMLSYSKKAAHIQGGPKIWHTFCMPELHQILTDFQTYHCLNQENICNNIVTKDPTTPQVCRYATLWNASVLKATTEKQDDFCNNTF